MDTRTINDRINRFIMNENGILLDRDVARKIALLLEEYGNLLEDEAAETCDEDDVIKAETVTSIARRLKNI